MIRLFDILVSFLAIIILSPLFLVIAIMIKADSKGTVFFKQERIGRNQIPFKILKFRTMRMNNEGMQITVGEDNRITKIGKKLRNSKIDELPQLINVLKGEMSFVGPRPEVPRYVNMYSEEQLKVFSVRPGITDYASIKFRNESELLAEADDPDDYYVNEIMPLKLRLNIEYIRDMSLWKNIKLIFQTLKVLKD